MQRLSQSQQIFLAPLIVPELIEETLKMLSEGKQSASVVEGQVDELENFIFAEVGEIEERRTCDAT